MAGDAFVGARSAFLGRIHLGLAVTGIFVPAPREQNPVPGVARCSQCQFGVIICTRQRWGSRSTSLPSALCGPMLHHRKRQALAIGAIASELIPSAL